MIVGIIGYRGHATRIKKVIKICKSRFNISKILTYHPFKKNSLIDTNDLKKILKCDCIFISTPTETHFEYIKKIKFENKYSGKIFCEKPPFANIDQINEIRKNDLIWKDLYFNYNFRKTELYNLLKNCTKQIGDVLSVHLNLTHGLAFKKNYTDSWRSNKKKHKLGVFETVGIHWVDLFINLFGEIKSYELFNKVGSNIGTAYDTSCAVFTHKDKNIFTSILVSYASCKYFKVICQGTDGVLEIDNNSFKIISPRDVFDEKGHFDYPNFKKNIYDFDKDYEMSLKHSIEFFLESAKSKKVFNKNSFLRGLKTNYFLINTTEKEVYNDDI